MKKILTFTLAVLLAVGPIPAQQPTVTFTTRTTLVIIDVAVKDKTGKVIENLRQGDFNLTEDGKPQQIAVFEFQKLDLDHPPAPEARPLSPAAGSATQPAPSAVSVKPGTPQPIIRYQDRRLVAMLFDFSTMAVGEQIRVQKSALDFIRTGLKPADLVTVMFASTGPVEVVQDFTDDKDLLETAIKKFRIGEGSDMVDNLGAGDTSDDNTFSADQTEFDIFNVDRKFYTIQNAAKLLAGYPEKKALMYFSSGITQSGMDNQAELLKLINVAKKANVAIYPVDARGMTASAPGGDATTKSGSGAGLFTMNASSSGGRGGGRGGAANDSAQETLSTMASDTGGKLFAEDNNLALGMEQARDDIGSYYILGYYSSNPKTDGKYRTVNVKLNRPDIAGAKLDYRHGYFAEKEFGKFTQTDKDDQLQEALTLGDPITDLNLAAEVNWFRLARDRYFVPLSVKIPGSEIALAKSKGNAKTELDFIGQIRDNRNQLQGQVADNVKIRLDEQSLAEINSRTIAYDTGFTVPPGSYKLKFLTRENETGKMGTYETSFVIPDLYGDTGTLKTSSIVLSSQRTPLKEAVGKADPRSKLTEANPLVSEGQQLVPSITRVFRKDQNLYLYAEVYDPTAGPDRKPDIAATLTFFRGANKMFESETVHLKSLLPKRGLTVPVQFQVPLAKLPTGIYTCQLNLVDENGKKFAFQRAELKIYPAQAKLSDKP
jgi:VWFA-related protein